MTTTDVAGLPAELRAMFARAGISQESAVDNADLSRSTYYRRRAKPGEWTLNELVLMAGAAGHTVRIELTSELERAVGRGNTPATDHAPDETVAGLGGLSG